MLATRLKQARLKLGVSQEKLGKMAGIDATSASARMNQYERGKHSPDFALVQRLAQILGQPASWFYTDDEGLARLQELYHRLRPAERIKLLATAETLGLQGQVAHHAPEDRACEPRAVPLGQIAHA